MNLSPSFISVNYSATLARRRTGNRHKKSTAGHYTRAITLMAAAFRL